MARSADPGLRQRWRDLLDKFDSKVETVSDFCSRHDVSAGSFYNWKRKLHADRSEPNAVSDFTAFLPVKVVNCENQSPVRLHLPGGACLDVPGDDRKLLFELVDHVSQRTPDRSKPNEEAAS